MKRETWNVQRPRVAAIILAAGASTRFGRPKQLLWVDGRPLLAKVTDAALASAIDDVVVVLGYRASEIAPLLAGRPVRLVVNPAWAEGMASSLRAGIAALRSDIDAALIVPADQIHLTAAEINAVITAYLALPSLTSLPRIIIPVHRGQRGHPVLFPRAFFPQLLALHGDQGGRSLLDRHAEQVVEVEVATDGVVVDVDTAADARAVCL